METGKQTLEAPDTSNGKNLYINDGKEKIFYGSSATNIVEKFKRRNVKNASDIEHDY